MRTNPPPALGSVESKWGTTDAAHFGYESEEDRKTKRGLEDWEIVEKIPESQKPVPYWFFAVVLVVLLVGIGLSFPFWGLAARRQSPMARLGLSGRSRLYCRRRIIRLVHGPPVRFIGVRSTGRGGRDEKREDDR